MGIVGPIGRKGVGAETGSVVAAVIVTERGVAARNETTKGAVMTITTNTRRNGRGRGAKVP